jgi:protein-S-isoprenylcysteine O-methyltransferase Ste14
MYDLLMRFPLMVYAVFAAKVQVAGLLQYADAGSLDFVHIIHIAMRLSTIAFTVLIATTVFLRTPPARKACGLEPRISALFGTFLLSGIVLFPRCELSLSLEMISTVSILIGTVGAIVALSQLGRSFSLMAETRRLVTSGPYRYVRHPLYLTEGIATIGICVQFASVWTALLLAIQIGFQLRRMHNEEVVLNVSFPEYAAYRQTTARLIPGLY